MKLSGSAAAIVLVLTAACGPANPPPPAVPLPASPPVAAAATPPAPTPPPLATCAPWPEGPFWFEASYQGPLGNHFRHLAYDDATGIVTLDDSDAFVKGGPTPRITKTKVTLAEPERAALRRNLHAICPTARDLKEECAPGGCANLEIKSASGAAHFQHHATVSRVMSLLEPLFPQIRGATEGIVGTYDVVLTEGGASKVVGTVKLTRSAEITVTSAPPDRAAWLQRIVDERNRLFVEHVEAPPAPDAPPRADVSRIVERSDKDFFPAMAETLRKLHGIELRRR